MGDAVTPSQHYVIEFKIDGKWIEATSFETMEQARKIEADLHDSVIVARIVVIKREFA